jgi:DNA-binding MarR family transcriptional regulator
LTASIPLRVHDAGIVGQLCCATIEGRRAAKTLGALSKQFELSEPEFELLWCLQKVASDGFDQKSLAGRLGFSPAQVSACVEKLRQRGLIACQNIPGDRRRHLWLLTGQGNELLNAAVRAASSAEPLQPVTAQAEAA